MGTTRTRVPNEMTVVHPGVNQGTLDHPAKSFSRWTLSRSKRMFDLLLGFPLLVVATPFMVLTALAVRVSAPGPVFFRQARTGKDGVDFEIVKFRTMMHTQNRTGPGVTQREDPRITPVGRLIRRSKLDELPQLWNVIRGDMSLVGPRPDVPEFLADLNPDEAQMLRLRPGITSLASLTFRHEEDLLPRCAREGELTSYYVERILPKKIRLELEYAEKATILSDLKILLRTAGAVLRP